MDHFESDVWGSSDGKCFIKIRGIDKKHVLMATFKGNRFGVKLCKFL